MYRELCSLTWSQGLWIQSKGVHLGSCSGQITTCLVRNQVELAYLTFPL